MSFSIWWIVGFVFYSVVNLVIWIKFKWKIYLGYLEEGDATLGSYRVGKKINNRFFFHSGGRVDLKKHPEYLLFETTKGKKRVLVEPWKREGNLYLEEGKTKVAVFDFVEDAAGNVIAIPCLRTVDTVVNEDTNDVLEGYKKTYIGVFWGEGKHKLILSEHLIGVVKYESF